MGISRKRPRTEPPSVEGPSNAQQAEPMTEPSSAPAVDGLMSSSNADTGAQTTQKDPKNEEGTSQEVSLLYCICGHRIRYD